MPRIDKGALIFPVVAVTMDLACLFVVTYLPVGRTKERHAIARSRAGPRGQAAFNAAWSDGRLTRSICTECVRRPATTLTPSSLRQRTHVDFRQQGLIMVQG